MIKIGVIGIGAMGKHHARIYSELSDVELVGIADVNEELVSSITNQYHTKAFTDYRELLKQDLDAVTIAVPTTIHKEVAIDVANEGINMLVEKPITDTIENAKKIIEVCGNNNVKLMIGYIERFNPIIPVIKNTIKNIDVISINITRVGPFPPRIKDVGVVIDLATHDIDLIRYLTNSEFKKVCGLTSKNTSGKEDNALISCRMENGILVHITTNWLTPFMVREINIATTEKFIRGQFIDQKVVEYHRYEEDGSYIVKDIRVVSNEPLKLELKAFIESIKKNKEPPITGYDGLKALEVALMVGV